MPASKKNKENLKLAVGQAFKEYEKKNPTKIKDIVKMKRKQFQGEVGKLTEKDKKKKSRAENRAAVARTLKLLEKQKKK